MLSTGYLFGETREEAIRNVKTLALRVVVDRLENGESLPYEILIGRNSR